MSIAEDGFALTAAVSPRVEYVASTGSTNADLVAMAADAPGGIPHLAMLLTHDQRRGRGRLDRTWDAPPGTALAVSTLVRVPGLPPVARGWIPLIAGAAMTRAVAAQARGTGHDVGLKWPNDVLLDSGKVCGILAEVVPNDPDAVVIGAGINTRMSRFDLPVDTATSFPAVGLECDEDGLLADYAAGLDAMLASLAAHRGDAVASGVREQIEALCSTIGSDVTVALPDGARLEGRARGIDESGRLVVETEGALTAVSAGDVVHVR